MSGERGFRVYGLPGYRMGEVATLGCMVVEGEPPEWTLKDDFDEAPLSWLYSLLEPDWDRAMATYHELQGWEPYHPIEAV